MSNFWDILHCMDLLMSEYSIPEPSQELFLEWGVIEVQMTHMSQPLMTQQWLSSSNGWGHPQRVRNGQKPCEEKAAATAGGAKLIQLILGQESPFPPAFHWVLVIHHSRRCQKSSTFFATNAPVTTSPGQTSCLELGVFALQIIEPCCVTVDLLATSQIMVVYSSASLVDDAGLSLDAIVFKVMQWGSSTTSSQFYSENKQKSHPRWVDLRVEDEAEF